MIQIPAISIMGWSGSGKTAFIEKLIPQLRARGLRVGVLKHDSHRFDMDREGKDTWRFGRAGADVVAIASPDQAAVIEYRRLELDEMLARIRDVDLIHRRGLTNPRICRASRSTAWPAANPCMKNRKTWPPSLPTPRWKPIRQFSGWKTPPAWRSLLLPIFFSCQRWASSGYTRLFSTCSTMKAPMSSRPMATRIFTSPKLIFTLPV